MRIDKAIKILETHNRWRRGIEDDTNYTTKELGEAIDTVVNKLKKEIKSEKELYLIIYKHTEESGMEVKGIETIAESLDEAEEIVRLSNIGGKNDYYYFKLNS